MIERSDFIARFLKKISKTLMEKLPKQGTLDEMYDETDRIISEDFWLK